MTPSLRRARATITGLPLSLLLAACADDPPGDRGGPEPRDSGGGVEASAELGPEGGELVASDGQGATLRLTVPPGALRDPTTIAVRPLDPVDGSPRFAIRPAGLTPTAPITLRLEGAALPDGALLRWSDVEGDTWVRTVETGGALVAEVASLGFRTEADASARAAAPGEAELGAAAIDCAADYEALTDALSAPIRRGDADAIVRELEGLRASDAACPSADIERRRALACARFDATVTTHRALTVESLDDFAFVAGGLARAHDAVVMTGGTCALEVFTPLLAEKYEQMLVFLAARYARTPFSDDVDRHLDELEELLRYESSCHLVGVDEDTCSQLRTQLFPGVLTRLRAAAWAECRETGIPTGPADLLAHRPAGVATAEPTDAYLRYAPYTVAELQRDAATCTGALELRVFDDADVPEELEGLRQSVGAGVEPGSFPAVVRTDARPAGALALRGSLQAERCGGPSAANGALVARVGGVELARVAAVRGAYPLDTLGLHVDVADALAAAGLPATGGAFDVLVQREDGACPLYPWPGELLRVEVQATEPQLDAELLGSGRSSVYSSIVTAVDCEEDDGDFTYDFLAPELDAVVPATLSVPGAALRWSVGAGLTGTWSATLPSMSDTCANGAVHVENSSAGFVSVVLASPRAPMDLLLTAPEAWQSGLALGLYADRAAALAGAAPLATGTPSGGGLAISAAPPQVLWVAVSGSAWSEETLDGAVISLTPVAR